MYRAGIWIITLAVAAVAAAGQVRTDRRTTREQWRNLTAAAPEAEQVAITYWNAPNNIGVYYAWTSSANWTAGVPGASDIAVFDGRTQGSVAGAGSIGVPIAFGRLETEDSYGGNIGQPGNSFFADGDIVFHGTGGGAISLGGLSAKRWVVLDNEGFGNIIYLQDLTANDFDVRILSGTVSIDGVAVLGTSPIVVYDGTVELMRIETLTLFEVRGGTVINGAEITELRISGGTVQSQNGGAAAAGGFFTDLWMTGGTYQNFSSNTGFNSANIDGGVCEFLDATVRTIPTVTEGPDGEFRAHQNTTVTNHLRLYPPLLIP